MLFVNVLDSKTTFQVLFGRLEYFVVLLRLICNFAVGFISYVLFSEAYVHSNRVKSKKE